MAQTVGTNTHPLDPLDAAEITGAVAAVRRAHDPDGRLRVISVDLDEPDKPALRAWSAGAARPPRRAQLILLDAGRGETHEAVVSLSDERVVSWTHVPGVHPAITGDEFMEAELAVKSDARYREGLARRGITDLDLVLVDPWSIGRFED
ncbi:MAG: primary-amine oxidase, partial [Gaiellales bacterium]